MKNFVSLLKKVELFEKLVVYGDRKSFLQALAQRAEPNYSPNPDMDEPLAGYTGAVPGPTSDYVPTSTNTTSAPTAQLPAVVQSSNAIAKAQKILQDWNSKNPAVNRNQLMVQVVPALNNLSKANQTLSSVKSQDVTKLQSALAKMYKELKKIDLSGGAGETITPANLAGLNSGGPSPTYAPQTTEEMLPGHKKPFPGPRA